LTTRRGTLAPVARRDSLGISNAIVGPVVRALKDAGLEVPVLDAAGESVVPGGLADSFLDGAAKALGDEAIGVRLAEKIPIGGLGMLDYALCTSPIVRDALRRVARYYGVVTQRVNLVLTEAGGVATLTFERIVGAPHSRHWAEFATAMLAQRMRQTLGRPVAFEEVSFAHDAPADASYHDAFFGRAVAFGASGDRLSFAAELLDLPLVTAAAALAETLEDRMRELAPAVGGTDPLLARVQVAVAELLDARDVGLPSLAARMHMARRTLQRELQNRGTSHKEILDHVLRERALRLLEEGRLTVGEIADRLGLSEPSAFFRAFRRWTGTSPSAFRGAGRPAAAK
jgi:AraC-like DNA-binding protein